MDEDAAHASRDVESACMGPVRSGYKIIYANVRNHDSVAKVSLRPSPSLLPVSIFAYSGYG